MMANWVYPVQAGVSYAYGVENDRYEAGYHTGVDFGAAMGDPVGAASFGRVVYAADSGGPYGKYIVIDHGNGVWSLYAHLSSINVSVGDQVHAGAFIGRVGDSGTNSSAPHLHFEIRRDENQYGADVNPIKFLEARGAESSNVNMKSNSGGSDSQGGDKGGDKSGKDNGPTAADFGFDPEFLKQHPGVAAVVDKAVKGEWSEARFQAELRDTEWWQSHTVAQRQWQTLLYEDPAEAKKTLEDARTQVSNMASSMGVRLTNEQEKHIAEMVAKNGMDTTELQLYLGQKWHAAGKPAIGQAATVQSDIRTLANEYALPIGHRKATQWTQEILSGRQTIEGYQEIMRQQALETYDFLKGALNNGMTVRQWADPYLQQAGQLLGINPEAINLTKGKFVSLLQPNDAGKPLTMDQWQSELMTKHKFGYDRTQGAQESAANLATEISRAMGA